MARLVGREAVYGAADQWRRQALIADGSVFGAKALWTASYIEELIEHFVQKPDMSSRDFESKLHDQLAPTSPEAKCLAAEMLWLMFLFPSKMGRARKVEVITSVWSWSGASLNTDQELLGAPLEHGIGHVGTAFNTGLWRELAFVVQLARAFKKLGSADRADLASDPWRFSEWLATLEEGSRRQMRHVLLHVLFPESFERIASGGARRSVDRTFAGLLDGRRDGPTSVEPLTALDQRLLAIRRVLEEQSGGTPIDFYADPYHAQWNPKGGDDDDDGLGIVPAAPRSGAMQVREPSARSRVWVIGAGEGASRWPAFFEQGIIAIGWDELGDLTPYRNREEIHAALRRIYDRERDPINDALACLQFSREVQVGDEVFVKQGRDRILGYGRVAGPYEHDLSVPDYRNIRRVEWISRGNWTLPEKAQVPTKTLTEVTDYRNFLRYLRPLVGQPVAATLEPYTIDEALHQVFVPRDRFEQILASLRRRKNVILQGSPGVGKSFVSQRLAYALIGLKRPDQVQMVQFHQSYAYEDFIQGWRPNGQGGFTLRNGVFYEFCRRAQAHPGERHVFIIDEINRGNLSKVMGELFLLIEADKRGPDFAIPLTYAESHTDTFYVPENVCLIGLMNTADRSLAMVDYALRRRFAFMTLEPAFDSPAFREALLAQKVDEEVIDRIVRRVGEVNDQIIGDRKNLGPGFAIGHSYFCPTSEVLDSRAWYDAVVNEEIRPLLEEYWFDDAGRVEQCMRILTA